jgi:hypothetical protein
MSGYTQKDRERYRLRKGEIEKLMTVYMEGLPQEWEVKVLYPTQKPIIRLRLTRKLLRGNLIGSTETGVGVELNCVRCVEFDLRNPITEESFRVLVSQMVSSLPICVEEYIQELASKIRDFHIRMG